MIQLINLWFYKLGTHFNKLSFRDPSVGHLLGYNGYKQVLYVGNNTIVKVEENDDSDQVMKRLGLTPGHVFLLAHKEEMTMGKSLRKSKRKNKELIDLDDL